MWTEGLLRPAEEAWPGGGRSSSRRAWRAAPLLPGSSRWPGTSRLLCAELCRPPWPLLGLALLWCCLPGLARGRPTGGGSERAVAELQGARPRRPGAQALRQVDESPRSATSLPPRPIL